MHICYYYLIPEPLAHFLYEWDLHQNLSCVGAFQIAWTLYGKHTPHHHITIIIILNVQ